jgi:hypothetical protein
MTVIELKCWVEPFEAIVDGSKPFDFRKDDRPYKIGVVLVLREFIPSECCKAVGEVVSLNGQDIEPCEQCEPPHGEYTGRVERRPVTYVMRGQKGTYLRPGRFGLPEGYCVLGLGPAIKKTSMCAPCRNHDHSKCTAGPEGDCGCPECYVAANRTAGLEGGA